MTLGKPGLSYFGVTSTPDEVAALQSVPLIDNIIETQLKEILGLPESESQAT